MKHKWISFALALMLSLTPGTPIGAELTGDPSESTALEESTYENREEDAGSWDALMEPAESLLLFAPESEADNSDAEETTTLSSLLIDEEPQIEEFQVEDLLTDDQAANWTGDLNSGELLVSETSEIQAMAGFSMLANYLHDSVNRPANHSYTSLSEQKDGDKTGIDLDESGVPRFYLKGRYVIDGGVTYDGKRYYADESGVLIRGWLKTLIPSREQDITNINDMDYHYRYCDPNTFEILEGYHTIEGLPHYFQTGGRMVMNQGLTLDGQFYYADQYGICSQVKLSYGNVLSSEQQQNNDSFLAKTQVSSVDPDTFLGQKGEYSFRPKWYRSKTSAEIFGVSSTQTSKGAYAVLTDKSLQGKVGIIYRRVGKYAGKEIDLVLTLEDWDTYSLNGDEELGYFLIQNNLIGVSIANLRSATITMLFLDHESQSPVVLKGFATFSDIDISQSLTILSQVDEVYVSDDCVLYKDPSSLSFTAPFELDRQGDLIDDSYTANWVQANYSSDHLTFRFGTSYEQYRFVTGDMPINICNYMIWKKDYSGLPGAYNIQNTSGELTQSWQGLQRQRLGRVSLSPLSKTVSDTDESHVTDNRLLDSSEEFYYTLSHPVPGEIKKYYYETYQVSDLISSDLTILENSLKVLDSGDQDVSDRFYMKVQDHAVIFEAKPDALASESFYDTTYHYFIGVTLRNTLDLSNYTNQDYTVTNRGTVQITRVNDVESLDSNEVITRIRMIPKPLPTGEIQITKKILMSEIHWAHGNPTFLFSISGKDTQGIFHQYERSITFRPDNYRADENGYAVLTASIPKIPLGTYQIEELSVLDYEITAASSDSINLSVNDSFLGTAVLTEEQPSAGITYLNQKLDYHGYRHNAILVNHIPAA